MLDGTRDSDLDWAGKDNGWQVKILVYQVSLFYGKWESSIKFSYLPADYSNYNYNKSQI